MKNGEWQKVWDEELGIELPGNREEALIWLADILSRPDHIIFHPGHWDYPFVKRAVGKVFVMAYPGLFNDFMN